MRKKMDDFLSSSTPHGLAYLSSNRPLHMRVIWLTFIILALICLGIMVNNWFEDMQQNPVATAVLSKASYQIPFPAVSFSIGFKHFNLPSKANVMASILNSLPWDCLYLNISCEDSKKIAQNIHSLWSSAVLSATHHTYDHVRIQLKKVNVFSVAKYICKGDLNLGRFVANETGQNTIVNNMIPFFTNFPQTKLQAHHVDEIVEKLGVPNDYVDKLACEGMVLDAMKRDDDLISALVTFKMILDSRSRKYAPLGDFVQTFLLRSSIALGFNDEKWSLNAGASKEWESLMLALIGEGNSDIMDHLSADER